jgi:hypothetical protein
MAKGGATPPTGQLTARQAPHWEANLWTLASPHRERATLA